uniref:Bulb-type lectin domain-containing protein n=1 Tax=Branchiostoma floridae TaxID=7739 RepID=C3Z830_BRAFL|eukprot:XP_002595332.1 hypothetical protein BRAFLDRAFT_87569 [Branchiostoma floridae]
MAQASPSNFGNGEDIFGSDNNIANFCIQPYAVKYQEDLESAHGPADCEVIPPYVVKYQVHDDSGSDSPLVKTGVANQNGQTNVASDDVDIEPYAAAYMDQVDIPKQDRPFPSQWLLQTPPTMSARKDKISRMRFIQMRCTCQTSNTLQLGLTTTLATTFTSGPTECCSTVPTPPTVSNSSQREEHHDRCIKMQKITFGGRGRGPGNFKENYGVAVSADMPGENRRLYHFGVAVDVKPGYLWVVGSRALYNTDAYVVQYSTDGLPIQKFNKRFMNQNSHPHIAIDVHNNNVIVGEGHAIMIFQPNGSLVRSFQALDEERIVGIKGVISDNEGNILLTDYKSIQKYSHFGHLGLHKGPLKSPRDILMDPSGDIIVANSGNNRVDMFTGHGKFVRTVENITDPWGLAMEPDGQLVVTNPHHGTVTIFPRRVMFSRNSSVKETPLSHTPETIVASGTPFYYSH